MKALIITVGIGTSEDKEKAARDLANGIAFSINGNNPDKVFFITTKEGKEITIPLILEILKNKFKSEKNYEIEEIKDANDFDECFDIVTKTIDKAISEGFKVTVDFTSGTKVMSAGAVLASIFKDNIGLCYISGKRDKGRVIPGTEKLQIFSPWKVLIEKQLEYLSTLFDNYQFNACIKIIDNIEKITIDPEIIKKIKEYKNICEGYYQWDIFNHEKAKEILLKEKKVPDKNKEFLGKLTSTKEKEVFLIADLLNNSKRRSMEGKYDDAVARLYRVIELLAQHILEKDYGINTSDVQLDKITEAIKNCPNLKDDLEKEKDEKGKIKIGLQKSYKLLNCLKNEIGEEFINNKKLQDLLKRRNESILAHGIKPIIKEDYDLLYEEVKKFSSKIISDLEDLMDKSCFPKFNTFK